MRTVTFFNRADELATLAERLDSPRAEYFVLYGRRRVGKSELLLHFGERCRLLYFEATSGSSRDQLDDLSAELATLTGRRIYAEQPPAAPGCRLGWRLSMAAQSAPP